MDAALTNNRSQVREAAFGSSSGLSPVAAERLLRVLIVDDDRDTVDTMAVLVRLWGHDARCAYDGATALIEASTALPDVVLLDIALPGVNGCRLAMQMRRGAGSNCLMIAVTGFGNEEVRGCCREAGIDLFLIKPVDAEVMETLLMLEGQRLGLLPETRTVIGAKWKNIGAPREGVLV
jgi:CheY-like chemotaxis protein